MFANSRTAVTERRRSQCRQLDQDLRAILNNILIHLEGLQQGIQDACRTVYAHDTWTCPASVQHALQKIIWILVTSAHPLGALCQMMGISFVHADQPLAEFCRANLATRPRREIPLPLYGEVNPYLEQIEAYLSMSLSPGHPHFVTTWPYGANVDANCIRQFRTHYSQLEQSFCLLLSHLPGWWVTLEAVESSETMSDSRGRAHFRRFTEYTYVAFSDDVDSKCRALEHVRNLSGWFFDWYSSTCQCGSRLCPFKY